MRISDWSSDVCSSDLYDLQHAEDQHAQARAHHAAGDQHAAHAEVDRAARHMGEDAGHAGARHLAGRRSRRDGRRDAVEDQQRRRQKSAADPRSEEHTSELQSLMRISYAVFCLKKKKYTILQVTVVSHHTPW